MQDKPRIPIHIFDCGQDAKSTRPIDGDESARTNAAIAQQKVNDLFAEYEARMAKLEEPPKEPERTEEDNLDDLVAKLRAPPTGEVLDPVARRKADLLLKMNAALRENNKAVIDEQERMNDPNYERKRNKDEYFKK